MEKEKIFDMTRTLKQVSDYYDKNFTEDIKIKPDYYSFLTGLFTCGKCGEEYRLFHLFHKTNHPL